jgi:effector-binding domain-containing protein
MGTTLTNEPRIETRPAQPYVGMRRTITMDTWPEVADRIPELFVWLSGKGIPPQGPPFIRLTVIDMARELQVEAGVPVDEGAFGEDPVFVGVLPAGRYLSYTHVGHPDELVDVTTAVFDWAATQGLEFDSSDAEDGEHWASRLVVTITNPAEEPDMSKWASGLLFKLAD